MNPGNRDRPLVLLTRTIGTDAAGAPVDTWKDCGTIWAEKVAATGNESTTSGAIRSTVTATYRIRYRADLAAVDAPGKFRARVDGRSFDIVSSIEDANAPRHSAILLTLNATQGEPVLAAVPTLP
jgi:SPP1 family predicted phage head-tail adaptor